MKNLKNLNLEVAGGDLKASPPGDDYKELEIAVLSHNGKILVSSSIIGVEH